MICQPCRNRQHADCPEVARQRTALTLTELAGGHRCDCQHQPSTEEHPCAQPTSTMKR